MKNRTLAVLASMVMVLALPNAAWAQKKIVIGHFGDPEPYKVIVADGSLEKATGWTIEWRKFNSGAEVNAAMASGGLVMSEIGSVPLAAGASQGVDYQMVGLSNAIGSSESLITRNGAGIDKPADLKGKKVAVPVGSTAHFSLMGALKKYGIAEKDVQIIGMSPPEIAAAWSQNAIDAAFIWEPVQSKLRENGKLMITASDVASIGYPTFNAWVANAKFAQENKAGVVAFLKAINDVNADYAKNKSAWNSESAPIKAIANAVGASPKDTVAALDGAIYPDAAMQMSAAWMGGGVSKTIKSTADFLKAAGRINATAADYGKFVNAEYAKAAGSK